MLRVSELIVPFSDRELTAAELHPALATKLGISPEGIRQVSVFKRSYDARKADLRVVYIVDVELTHAAQEAEILARLPEHPHVRASPDMAWQMPAQAPADWKSHWPTALPRPVVVGFGPCGIFAALCLAQMGLCPIVLERGKTVRERTQDTWGLWRKNVLNPESNVQFGEGGAGTFSDGKLYSQIRDPRFLGRKVMQELVQAGAPADILFEAHPHIGTFKLVKVVENLRREIQSLGGEIRFQQKVCDFEVENGAIRALQVQDLRTGQLQALPVTHVVLALGHSARDTFAALWRRRVAMEAKPFSIGVRIEHPQSVIDRARWGRHAGHPRLGAADYKLVHHASNGRTVYSFCMCPGGTVVAATSEPGQVVTNGMSQYSRAERNANAALVVGIEPEDFPQQPADWVAAFGVEPGEQFAREADALRVAMPAQTHPLAGIVLQRALERQAFAAGGASYAAPAQRVGDFLQARPSVALGSVLPSYKPAVTPGTLTGLLPDYVLEALREALPAFGRKIRGYDMPDAVMTGVETRTSSPLRLLRNPDLQSPNTRGVYPAGEGAGYAGGILSAGVDGIRVAEALAADFMARSGSVAPDV